MVHASAMTRLRPRDNPFAVQNIERILYFRPEWIGLSVTTILDTIIASGGIHAITGRHGSGKTTLLDLLASRLNAAGYPVTRYFFNDQRSSLSPNELVRSDTTVSGVVLIDGDERLGWRDRRFLFRHHAGAGAIVLARHRAGSCRGLVHLTPNSRVLHRAVAELAPDHYPILACYLDTWFARDRGNFRDVFRRCYFHLMAGG